MFSVTKKFEFDAAHRVLGHSGRCKSVHGHSYSVEITATQWTNTNLDSLGMVVDFGDLKEVVKGWIDANWEHTLILNPEDPLLGWILENDKDTIPYVMGSSSPLALYRMNPTAENMARELWYAIAPQLQSKCQITRVRVYETKTCCADFEL
jgi:6-pyruvoyltetrahydropterin/6-carboxytetrahydropterin synthase